MKHSPVDRYSGIKSPVHKVPASYKAFISIIVILSLSLPFKSPVYPLIVIAISFICFAISRIPSSFILKRYLFLMPFAILVLFMKPENPAVLFTKVIASLSILLLFTTTTPFAELLRVMRKARIPSTFILLISSGYRYFFLLIDEAERNLRAWKMRGGDVKKLRLKSLSRIVFSIFIRSMKRAESIGHSMKMRGYL